MKNKTTVSFGIIKKLFITLAIAVSLAGCNDEGISEGLGQKAPLTVNDIDYQSILNLLPPSIKTKNQALYSIDVDLGIKGEGTLIDLVVDELSIDDVVNTLGYLPSSQAINLSAVQVQSLKDIKGVSPSIKLQLSPGSHKVDGLKVQTYYRFKARSCYEKVSDKACSKQSVYAIDRTLSLDLGFISLTSLTANSQQADIAWTRTNGADFYRVQRKSGNSDWSPIGPKLKSLLYTDRTVVSKVIYEYRVEACQYKGQTLVDPKCILSNSKTILIPKNNRFDTFPSANVKTVPSYTSINIALTSLADSEAPVYFLQRRELNGKYVTIKKIDETDSSPRPIYNIVDTGRTESTTYHYRVRACSATSVDNCYGWYNFSDTTLQKPSSVKLEGEVSGYSSNALSWSPVEGTETYVIERSKGGAPYKKVSEVLAIPVSNPYRYTDSNLSPNSPYTYKVSSCNRVEQKLECPSVSNELSLTTDAKLLDKPSVRNLTVTSLSTKPQLTVSWNEYSPVPSYYKISYKESGSSDWTILSSKYKQVSYIHSGLKSKQTYDYKVVACIRNDSNCTPDSQKSGTTVQEFSLDIPITANLLLGEGTIANVNWGLVSGITSQRLLARKRAIGSSNHTKVDFGLIPKSQAKKENVALEPNFEYQFYLELCGSNNVCKDTTTSSAWIRTYEPIDTSISFIQEDGKKTYATNREIKISWTYSGTEPLFYLYRRKAVASSQVTDIKKIKHTSQIDSLLETTGLTPSTDYLYEVRPCRADNWCSKNWYAIAIKTDKDLGNSPNLKSVTPYSFDAVNLTYAVPSEASYYQIYRKKDGETDFTVIGGKQTIIDSSVQTYKDSSVEPGTGYSYKVEACRLSASNCFASSVLSVSLPHKLTGSPDISIESLSTDKGSFTWSYADPNNQTPIYFQVENKAKGDSSYVVVDSKSATPRATIDKLLAGKDYKLRVRACLPVPSGATENCGNWSSKDYKTVNITDTTNFSATKEGNNSVSLSWTQPANLPENGIYKISRASADVGQPFGSYDKVTERPLTDTSYQDSGLGYNKDYSYKLQICDASGNNCTAGKLSDRVTVGTNLSGKPVVQVNPGADRAIITLSGAKSNQQYQVVVKDKDGNIVSSKKSATSPITVSGLDAKKGPYTTESSLCDTIKCGSPEVTRFSLVSDPTSFSATNIKGANEATLSWSTPSTLPTNGIYKISRASADVGQPFGPYSEVTRLKSLTDTSYKNSGLGYNKDYSYKLQICDASGNNCTAGKLSDRVTVGTNLSGKPVVQVNPGADRAIITLSGAKPNQQYQVVVKDKDGNIVSSKKSATSPITVSGLDAKKGPYTTESSLCDAIKCGSPEVTRFSLVSDPTSFSATNIKGANEATLSWSAPSTLPKNGIYKISRASADVGQPFGPYSEVTRLKSLTDTSYKNSGLGYNKDYRYKFQICDASGNNCTAGKLSDRVTVGTDTSKKPSVSVNPGADRAIITLSGAKPNQQYQVVVKDKDGNIVSSKKSATSPITVSGLDVKNGPYTAESSLCDAIKCGAPEVTRFSLVSDPTSFSATNIKGANEATLSWSAPSTLPTNGIYKISRASANVGQYFGPYSEVTRLKSLTDTSYKNSGLGYNKDYRYKFQICDASGNNCTAGKLSDRVTVGTNLSGKPVVQVNPGADRAIITLSGAKSNQQYQVVVKDKDGNIVSSKKSATSPITVSGLDAKKGPYTTESSLCDAIKCGSPEVTRFSLVSDPTSFSATNIKGANEATLSWSTPSTLPKNGIYKISRASADVGQYFGPYSEVTRLKSLTDTSYQDSGLGYNKDYSYKFQVCDASGNNCTSGKLSNRVTVGTDTSKKPSVSVNPGADRATITLSGAKPNQQYQVVVKDKDGNIVSIKKSATSPITVSGLDAKKGPYTTESSLCDAIKCGAPEVTRFSLVSDPTSFSATNIKGANEATLSWSTPSTLPTNGIYKISRASANVGQYFGPYSEVTRLKSLTDTSYQDSGLGYNKDYSYKFQVCDASGNNCTSGKLSNRVKVAADINKKPSVSVNPGIDRATITLSGVGTLQNYKLVLKDKYGSIVSSQRTLTTPYTFYGLNIAKSPYTLESSLCNPAQCGSPEVTRFSLVSDPTSFSATNIKGANEATLSWSTPSTLPTNGIYKISRASANAGQYFGPYSEVTRLKSLADTSYQDSGLGYNKDYSYKFQVCDSSGNRCTAGKLSNRVRVAADINKKPSVSVNPGIDRATITLSGVGTLQNYKLVLKDKYGSIVSSQRTLTTPYTFYGLNIAKSPYTLESSLCNPAQCGSPEVTRFSLVSDPTSFSATNIKGANEATLSWSTPSTLPTNGIYKISRASANVGQYFGPYSEVTRLKSLTDTSYQDSGLGYNKDYSYKLQVCDASGSRCTSGKLSNRVTVATDTNKTPMIRVVPSYAHAQIYLSGAESGQKYKIIEIISGDNRRFYTNLYNTQGYLNTSLTAVYNPYKVRATICDASGSICGPVAEKTFNMLNSKPTRAPKVQVTPEFEKATFNLSGAGETNEKEGGGGQKYRVIVTDKDNRIVHSKYHISPQSYSVSLSSSHNPYKVRVAICDSMKPEFRCGPVSEVGFNVLSATPAKAPVVGVTVGYYTATFNFSGAQVGQKYKIIEVTNRNNERLYSDVLTGDKYYVRVEAMNNPYKVRVAICDSSGSNCGSVTEKTFRVLGIKPNKLAEVIVTPAYNKATFTLSGADTVTQKYKIIEILDKYNRGSHKNVYVKENNKKVNEYSANLDSRFSPHKLRVTICDSSGLRCGKVTEKSFSVLNQIVPQTPTVNVAVEYKKATFNLSGAKPGEEYKVHLIDKNNKQLFERYTTLSSYPINLQHEFNPYKIRVAICNSSRTKCSSAALDKVFNVLEYSATQGPTITVLPSQHGATFYFSGAKENQKYKIISIPGVGPANNLNTYSGEKFESIRLHAAYNPYKIRVAICDASGSNCGPIAEKGFNTFLNATALKESESVSGSTLRTIKVNDTGVTWRGLAPIGGTASSVGSICNDEGSLSGQDCSTGRDAESSAGILSKQGSGVSGFDFSKLDESGKTLPSTASSWSCVRDNVTGLVWEAKTSDKGLHSSQWKYSWYGLDNHSKSRGTLGSSPDGKNCGSGSGAPSSCDTHNYVDKVNSQGYCGISNWRLPKTEELRSIALIGNSSSSIDANFFPNTASGSYWTSSLWQPNNIKTVSFTLDGHSGVSKFTDSVEPAHIRLVSSSSDAKTLTADSSLKNFEIFDGGASVKDVRTGLIWSRCLVGTKLDNGGTPSNDKDDICVGTSSLLDWQTALNSGDDESGWRVPNVKELGSILDSQSQISSALDTRVFPVVSDVSDLDKLILWTSTPSLKRTGSKLSEQNSTSSWSFSSYYGLESQDLRSKRNRVLLVR